MGRLRSSIRAVSGQQTVVQQNGTEALHQNRNPIWNSLLSGLSSLASVDWDPASKISKQLAS